MNRSYAFVLILASLMVLSIVTVKPANASAGSWTPKASMQVARSGLGVAVVNGKIYAIGGSTESGTNVNIGGLVGTNEEYDPATDTWTLKASMPTPRRDFSIFAYKGKVYCVGGVIGYNVTGGIATTAHEVYNPVTNTWQTITPAPTARAGVSATVVGDKIYCIGGSPNYTLNEVYDPVTDSWTTKSPMPTGVAYSSAVVDNKIYLMGAHEPKMEIYDTQMDSWSFGSPPPSTAYGGVAVATTGAFAPKRIYFLGLFGWMSQGAMPNRIYDPKTGSWILGAEVPTNREGFGVGIINDTLYVVGGRSHTFPYPGDGYEIVKQSAANEQYTPLGYGTPDPTYQSPSPTPSSSPNPHPSQLTTPTPAISPTIPPTPTTSPSATQQPSPSTSGSPAGGNSGVQVYVYWIGAVAVAAAALVAAAVLLRKRH